MGRFYLLYCLSYTYIYYILYNSISYYIRKAMLLFCTCQFQCSSNERKQTVPDRSNNGDFCILQICRSTDMFVILFLKFIPLRCLILKLTYVLLSTTTHFISLVNTCYMLQSVTSHAFKIHTHFSLSFKIMYVMSEDGQLPTTETCSMYWQDQ
jgi:hypothetical protein